MASGASGDVARFLTGWGRLDVQGLMALAGEMAKALAAFRPPRGFRPEPAPVEPVLSKDMCRALGAPKLSEFFRQTASPEGVPPSDPAPPLPILPKGPDSVDAAVDALNFRLAELDRGPGGRGGPAAEAEAAAITESKRALQRVRRLVEPLKDQADEWPRETRAMWQEARNLAQAVKLLFSAGGPQSPDGPGGGEVALTALSASLREALLDHRRLLARRLEWSAEIKSLRDEAESLHAASGEAVSDFGWRPTINRLQTRLAALEAEHGELGRGVLANGRRIREDLARLEKAEAEVSGSHESARLGRGETVLGQVRTLWGAAARRRKELAHLWRTLPAMVGRPAFLESMFLSSALSLGRVQGLCEELILSLESFNGRRSSTCGIREAAAMALQVRDRSMEYPTALQTARRWVVDLAARIGRAGWPAQSRTVQAGPTGPAARGGPAAPPPERVPAPVSVVPGASFHSDGFGGSEGSEGSDGSDGSDQGLDFLGDSASGGRPGTAPPPVSPGPPPVSAAPPPVSSAPPPVSPTVSPEPSPEAGPSAPPPDGRGPLAPGPDSDDGDDEATVLDRQMMAVSSESRSLDDALAEAKAELEGWGRKKLGVLKCLEKALAALKTAQAERAALEATLGTVEAQLADVRREHLRATDRYRVARAKIKDLERSHQDLARTASAERDSAQAQAAEISAQAAEISRLKQVLSDQKAAIDGLDAQRRELADQKAGLLAELDELKAAQSGLAVDLAGREEELREASRVREHLGLAIAGYRRQLARLTAAMDALRASWLRRGRTIAEGESERESLRVSLDKRDRELVEAVTKRRALMAELGDLRLRMGNLASERAGLMEELDRLRREAGARAEAAGRLEGERGALMEELERVKAESAASAGEASRLREEGDRARKTIDEDLKPFIQAMALALWRSEAHLRVVQEGVDGRLVAERRESAAREAGIRIEAAAREIDQLEALSAKDKEIGGLQGEVESLQEDLRSARQGGERHDEEMVKRSWLAHQLSMALSDSNLRGERLRRGLKDLRARFKTQREESQTIKKELEELVQSQSRALADHKAWLAELTPLVSFFLDQGARYWASSAGSDPRDAVVLLMTRENAQLSEELGRLKSERQSLFAERREHLAAYERMRARLVELKPLVEFLVIKFAETCADLARALGERDALRRDVQALLATAQALPAAALPPAESSGGTSQGDRGDREGGSAGAAQAAQAAEAAKSRFEIARLTLENQQLSEALQYAQRELSEGQEAERLRSEERSALSARLEDHQRLLASAREDYSRLDGDRRQLLSSMERQGVDLALARTEAGRLALERDRYKDEAAKAADQLTHIQGRLTEIQNRKAQPDGRLEAVWAAMTYLSSKAGDAMANLQGKLERQSRELEAAENSLRGKEAEIKRLVERQDSLSLLYWTMLSLASEGAGGPAETAEPEALGRPGRPDPARGRTGGAAAGHPRPAAGAPGAAEPLSGGYAGEGYAGEGYAGDEYAGGEYAGEGYPGERYPGDGYPGDDYAGDILDDIEPLDDASAGSAGPPPPPIVLPAAGLPAGRNDAGRVDTGRAPGDGVSIRSRTAAPAAAPGEGAFQDGLAGHGQAPGRSAAEGPDGPAGASAAAPPAPAGGSAPAGPEPGAAPPPPPVIGPQPAPGKDDRPAGSFLADLRKAARRSLFSLFLTGSLVFLSSGRAGADGPDAPLELGGPDTPMIVDPSAQPIAPAPLAAAIPLARWRSALLGRTVDLGSLGLAAPVSFGGGPLPAAPPWIHDRSRSASAAASHLVPEPPGSPLTLGRLPGFALARAPGAAAPARVQSVQSAPSVPSVQSVQSVQPDRPAAASAIEDRVRAMVGDQAAAWGQSPETWVRLIRQAYGRDATVYLTDLDAPDAPLSLMAPLMPETSLALRRARLTRLLAPAFLEASAGFVHQEGPWWDRLFRRLRERLGHEGLAVEALGQQLRRRPARALDPRIEYCGTLRPFPEFENMAVDRAIDFLAAHAAAGWGRARPAAGSARGGRSGASARRGAGDRPRGRLSPGAAEGRVDEAARLAADVILTARLFKMPRSLLAAWVASGLDSAGPWPDTLAVYASGRRLASEIGLELLFWRQGYPPMCDLGLLVERLMAKSPNPAAADQAHQAILWRLTYALSPTASLFGSDEESGRG